MWNKVWLLSLIMSLETILCANEYLYKRGFLYCKEAPYYIPPYYEKVDDSLWIDRSQTVIFSEDRCCCLIGFCVDIRSHTSPLTTIINELANALKDSEESFYEYGEYLCGRYVIFYKLKDGSYRIITDATGFRPVFHNANATIITSHAKLAAVNVLKQDILNDKRVTYFNETDLTRETQFSGVFQLNPNSSLKLNSGRIDRFFPRKNVTSLSKEEMVNQFVSWVGMSLKGLVHNQQKPLLLSLTGGFDSRATLSIMLLNNIKPHACFTFLKLNTPGYYQDNTVAQNLCRALKIQHFCINTAPYEVTRHLEEAIQSNCQLYTLTDRMVFNLTKIIPADLFIHVNSNVAEIWRWFNTQNLRNKKNREYLHKAYLIGLEKEKTYNFNLSALWYWENRMGRFITDHWLATDLVFDTFNPFNSRKIISMMMSLPTDFHSTEEIHQLLIDKLCKTVSEH